MYCDPPYVRSTRSSQGRLYNYEFDDEQHARLLDLLTPLRCAVILSGYDCELYRRKLEGWGHATFQAMTRGGKPATEHLWYNFEPPAELHDYRFLGGNFRERERIRRMQKRWARRLERMPDLERQALLAAIEATAK